MPAPALLARGAIRRGAHLRLDRRCASKPLPRPASPPLTIRATCGVVARCLAAISHAFFTVQRSRSSSAIAPSSVANSASPKVASSTSSSRAVSCEERSAHRDETRTVRCSDVGARRRHRISVHVPDRYQSTVLQAHRGNRLSSSRPRATRPSRQARHTSHSPCQRRSSCTRRSPRGARTRRSRIHAALNQLCDESN